MEDKILKNYVEDQIKKAVKKGASATKFLTPTQLEEALNHITFNKFNQEVDIIEDGGYIGAERKRLIFLNKQWGELDRQDWLTALLIEHRKQDNIGHRDILGALMNMGIERNTVGDIETKGKQPTLVCIPEVGKYIVENLEKIGNIGVRIVEISIEELGERVEELEGKLVIASSMRIDCLLAEIYNISRTQATALIQQGKVSLNHQIVIKQDDKVDDGDTIALRGKGKVKVLAQEGMTKKDRIKVKIGIYI